jgi:hypothetical protein
MFFASLTCICNNPATPCCKEAFSDISLRHVKDSMVFCMVLRQISHKLRMFFASLTYLSRIISVVGLHVDQQIVDVALQDCCRYRPKMRKTCKVCGQSAKPPYIRPWNLGQAGGTPKSCPPGCTSSLYSKICYVGGLPLIFYSKCPLRSTLVYMQLMPRHNVLLNWS